ncbi:MAG: IS701 family transposase [Phycisphaerae bacterium]|nr:IS701 family transposase [Phycisphaerae bacterium]
MDADTVLKIKPALTQYLHEFDGCFGRVTARQHLDTYVLGQLGELPRKSIEPIADAAGTPPRTLQEFLSLYRWDESAMRDRLQQLVARRDAHEHSVGILDETSFVKKGNKTACVQRQHCGAVGKMENCVVSVHLGYATPDFHTLLDGDLYLPKDTWHEDRSRCRAAGIPDDVVYRPKWQIGLEQIRRARANGIRFAWMTFDEGYGGKPPFLRGLDELGQNYVGEVPVDFRVWTQPPEVLYRQHARHRRGRARKLPRLKAKNNPPVEVRHVASYSPRFRREDWQTYHVKDGRKGPAVWRAKRILVWLRGEDGLPGAPHHLLVAYNVLEPEKVKYFISNGPQNTPVETLLLVALSRWKIERMFEDGKGELGLDHFEVRQFQSIQRHLILSCVSYLFLAEFHEAHRGEKSGADDLPGSHGDSVPGAGLGAGRPLLTSVSRIDQQAIDPNPGPQCQVPTLASETNAGSIACTRPVPERHAHVSVEGFVAL